MRWNQVAIWSVQKDLGCEVVDRDGEAVRGVERFGLEVQRLSVSHGADEYYVQWIGNVSC